jgi:hypothetical protein
LPGSGLASFGVSASAIPYVRKIDSVSAANFFIASLFYAKFDPNTGKYANHPVQEGSCPVLLLRQMNLNIL